MERLHLKIDFLGCLDFLDFRNFLDFLDFLAFLTFLGFLLADCLFPLADKEVLFLLPLALASLSGCSSRVDPGYGGWAYTNSCR